MRRPLTRLAISRLALLCALVLAYAMAGPPAVRADGRWRRFSAPENPDPNADLLSNAVRALAYDQDDQGIPQLWAGTDRGLQTYNGRGWQDHSEPAKEIRNSQVTALLADRARGVLWVGTEQGLNWRTAQGTWQATGLTYAVRAMALDGDGGVYAGTGQGQVWHCKPAGDQEMDCEVWLDHLDALQALLYHEGVLWIGTSGGLVRAEGASLTSYGRDDGLGGDRVTALAMDSMERLWIATDRGITRYDETVPAIWHSFADAGYVHSIAVDDRDRVWAATDAGLLKWDPRWERRDVLPDRWQRLGAASGDLRQDQVSLVFAQPEGILWVVTPAGLSALDGSWETYSSEQIVPGLGQPVTQIRALLQDAETEELWVGTDVGLSHYSAYADEWDRTWTALDGLEGEVWSLARDAERATVWAGTGSGVFAYDRGADRWNHLGSGADDNGGSPVWDLVWDRQNRTLWAGTDGGLLAYDVGTGRWRPSWPTLDGRTGEAVYRLIRDEESGALWLGTSLGVVRYEPQTGRSEHFWPAFEQVSLGRITALLRDRATGDLWVSTGDQLLRYDGSEWSLGRAPAEVFALAQDAQRGVLWAGTSSGVLRYDPDARRWDELSRGVSGISGQGVRVVARDERTGELWAGTQSAVARSVSSLTRDLPWVRLTLALSGRENKLQEDGTVKLLDVHSVDYQFEGGSLIAELGELSYGYQLEGVDTAARWTRPEQGLQATYTELPYGRYALALWVQDSEGRRSGIEHYPLAVQARPVVTLTQVLEQAVSASEVVSFSVDPGETVPVVVQWSDPDGEDVQPRFQAGWFDQQLEDTYIIQRLDTLSKIARERGQNTLDLARYNGIPDPDVIIAGQELRIPLGEPPDVSCAAGQVGANCWVALSVARASGDEVEGGVPLLEASGSYQLLIRAIDADGNISAPYPPIRFQVSPGIARIPLLPWLGVLGGVLIVVTAGYALRRYPDYAGNWGAAVGDPVQQLIPLVAPLDDPLDVVRVHAALQERQAYTTPDQVHMALEALVRRRILMHAEGGGYTFVDPLVAWLHRLRNLRRGDTLAEAVRSRHPLYAGARTFFMQAGFAVEELSPEAFLLTPAREPHPQSSYGPIYTRLVAGRALGGDDFEDVDGEARALYEGEVSHRLAFVVINRRPTPGARLRLYEIRQGSGLAIVTLDSELFGQVKPNMPASDILAAQIDQATGRQNLYAISGPVSDDLGFFGRETVLQQLIDLIDAGQPVGVFGLRKTGKTSLLQRLRGRLATRRVIAALDMQGTAREHGVLSLYPAIVGAFVAHIQQYRPGLTRSVPSLHLWPTPRGHALSPELSRFFADDLRDLHELIGGDERLLLILDEIDRLLPANQDPGYEGFSTFLGQLRAANQGLGVLDLIVVGVDPAINRRDTWEGRDNELYQALHEVWMPPMRPEATREMIESMGYQMGFQYAPAALDRIVKAGGGQPFLTRQICSQIIKDLLDRGAVTITDKQARLGIEDYVYLPDSYLTELWRARLDDEQRALLLHLARASAPIARGDLLPADRRQIALSTLGALEEQTIICRQDGGYVVGWPILRDWIRWIELGLDD